MNCKEGVQDSAERLGRGRRTDRKDGDERGREERWEEYHQAHAHQPCQPRERVCVGEKDVLRDVWIEREKYVRETCGWKEIYVRETYEEGETYAESKRAISILGVGCRL